MAKATQSIVHALKTPEMVQQESLEKLQLAVADNADGLQQLLQLTTALRDSGLLDIVLAMLKQGDAVLKILVNVSNQPGAAGSIKTLLALVQGFGELDAVSVGTSLSAVSRGLKSMSETTGHDKQLGIFDLLRTLKDERVNAGLQKGLAFLQGFGAATATEEGHTRA